MYNYIKLSDVNNYNEIKELWNSEVGFIYPISELIFNQNITNCKYLLRDGSYLAYDKDELVGFIVTKVWDDDERIPTYKNFGWVSLFFVKRSYRRKGIGSKLLELAELKFNQLGKTEIIVGKDINNFFPGIPVDFNHTSPDWFSKRGFKVGKCTHDLVCKNFDREKLSLTNSDKFTFRFAKKEDREKIIKFFSKNFPGRWLYECEEYFNRGQFNDDYLIVLDNDDVIAFIRNSDQRTSPFPYNLTWYTRFEKLGGLGPLGVDKDYRKLHLGGDVVKAGINSLLDKGVKEILIDWTSLLEFYGKYGFEVWKCYFYANKTIIS